jgi:hypothetical protein
MRRAIAATAIVIVGGCSGAAAHPTSVRLRNADATPTTTTVPSKWCVLPISRKAAIAQVMKISDEVAATDTAKAKLFGMDYWAVEVEGSVTPAFSHGGRFAWAVFNVDAHTGDLRGMSAGPPGSTPSDWNSLPDPAAGCAHG